MSCEFRSSLAREIMSFTSGGVLAMNMNPFSVEIASVFFLIEKAKRKGLIPAYSRCFDILYSVPKCFDSFYYASKFVNLTFYSKRSKDKFESSFFKYYLMVIN